MFSNIDRRRDWKRGPAITPPQSAKGGGPEPALDKSTVADIPSGLVSQMSREELIRVVQAAELPLLRAAHPRAVAVLRPHDARTAGPPGPPLLSQPGVLKLEGSCRAWRACIIGFGSQANEEVNNGPDWEQPKMRTSR